MSGPSARAAGTSARRLRRCDSGAAAVEFALVLPILVILVMGIIEFGRAWNRSQVVTDAAREGARRAVVRDGQDKMQTVPPVIQDRLSLAGLNWDGTLTGYENTCANWSPPGGDGVLIVSGCGWGDTTGHEARVAIRAPYPFNLLRPVLRLVPGDGDLGPVMISTNFVMRNE